MPDKEILETLAQREIETLEILLSAKAARTAITIDEYVKLRMLQDSSLEIIKADLLLDLEQGGRIFGEFRSAIKTTANGSIHRFRDIGLFSEEKLITDYRWVAVLVNTCPDCLARHGKIKKWDGWETVGLPRTGATVCREACKCMLVPAENTEVEPVKRGRKKK